MTELDPYSLQSIMQEAFKRRRLILLFTLAAITICVISYFVFPGKYKAETVFVLKNPLYGDRNNLYNNENTDYFAGEIEIDRLISMAESDEVQINVIRKFDLGRVYDLDTTKPKDYIKLKKLLTKRLKLYRAESRNIVLQYTDKDPARSADVANYAVDLLENSFRMFYNDMRRDIYQSIMGKISEQDSAISILSDTLIRLRQQYRIYDIISPSRNNLMLSGMKDNGVQDFARGLELIQNIESVKDEVVYSKAKNITLMNQYTTGARMYEQSLTTVIRKATPPVKRAGLPLLVLIMISALAGFFFSLLYVLFRSFLYSRRRDS